MDDLHRRILTALDGSYPTYLFSGQLSPMFQDISQKLFIQEVAHLNELGLVEAAIHVSSDGENTLRLVRAKITAAGRDYLKGDGGLSAELGVVTVRIHADSIRALINAKIEASELEASAKSKLKEAVQNLPAHTLQEVVTGLVQRGLESGPAAIQWLQTMSLPGI